MYRFDKKLIKKIKVPMRIKKNIHEKLQLLDFLKIPEHVAIIMDGNRRWAKKNQLSCLCGHKKGADILINIVKMALKLNIKILTVFAFSTENWLRSSLEVKNLMNLFDIYLKKYSTFMQKEKIKLNLIGDISKCSFSLQKSFQKIINKTKDGDKLDFVIAINYGSRNEIKRALLKILNDYDDDKIIKKDITEDFLRKYLDTKNFKDPDLLIRTSGEMRISNFLLWQISYSEIYVTDVLWPQFSENDFLDAILEYQKRKRRLGGK